MAPVADYPSQDMAEAVPMPDSAMPAGAMPGELAPSPLAPSPLASNRPAPRAAKSTAAGATDAPLTSKQEVDADAHAPLLIYEGTLGIMAPARELAGSMDEVIDIAESFGGHLAGRNDQRVQVRVPSATFRRAMMELAKLGEVTQQAVSAQDVTEEFHDLEVRLDNLHVTRKRLEQFMAKANTMQEMLTVEKELERVAQQIDQISGRLKFLRSRAAFSLISVSFSPKPETPKTIATPSPPPPPPRGVKLPIDWLNHVGLGSLMQLD